MPYLENPQRMDKILIALGAAGWSDIQEPADFGLDPILAVHDPGYIEFLASAWDEWISGSGSPDFTTENPILLPATFALRRHPHKPASLLGRAGYYIMDLSTGIGQGTYAAALAAANCALSGAKFIKEETKSASPHNDRPPSAFALCRPPGHHAGRDYAAGYCFLNNAAIAANWLSAQGKVAMLDIDYHAGNGTQDIFYDRSDVLTLSLHADPNNEYPYYAGYPDEGGVGEGLGFHHNFPLPTGINDAGYLAALEEGLNMIVGVAPKYLVISLGADIYRDDPLGRFNITTRGFYEIGRKVAGLGLPTLIVMEGGYNNDALGENIVSFLSAFI